MRSRFALVVLTACGGVPSPAVPRGRPNVRLVQCLPANPPPQLEMVEDLGGESEDDGLDVDGDVIQSRQRPGGGRGPVAGRPSRGTVSLGTATAAGALSTERVVDVMRTRLGDFKGCYERELARATVARAAVQWRFTIRQDGRVLGSTETSHLLGTELTSCVSRVLGATVFPAAATMTAVLLSIVFETGAARDAGTPDLSGTVAWTPFALDLGRPAPVAAVVGRATEAALRRQLPAIETCFGASAATGSLRVMMRINAIGELAGLRVGGMGDAASERCIAKALAQVTVVTPASNLVEVACDLSRGDARPWRVAPASGYDVIEASASQLRRGEITVSLASEPPDPLPDAATYLVVAQPDTPGLLLQHAFTWASSGTALLAVGDGRAPPLYLGVGSTGNSAVEELDEGDVVRPVLHVGARALTVCVNRATQQAKLRDARAVGALVQRVAAKCRALRCAATLQIAIDNDARVRDLVEVVGAARSAGFDRVLLGGDAGCTPLAKD